MDVETSLDEGGGNETDDVDFSEAEEEEFAETRSESVDAFVVASFCLLYPCHGVIGHVEMFDEMFGAFDHPPSNIGKFWFFSNFNVP